MCIPWFVCVLAPTGARLSIYNCTKTTSDRERWPQDARTSERSPWRAARRPPHARYGLALLGPGGLWRSVRSDQAGLYSSSTTPLVFGRGVVAVVHKRTPDVSKNMRK